MDYLVWKLDVIKGLYRLRRKAEEIWKKAKYKEAESTSTIHSVTNLSFAEAEFVSLLLLPPLLPYLIHNQAAYLGNSAFVFLLVYATL